MLSQSEEYLLLLCLCFIQTSIILTFFQQGDCQAMLKNIQKWKCRHSNVSPFIDWASNQGHGMYEIDFSTYFQKYQEADKSLLI